MKAARLHAYGQFPIVEDVAEPAVSGPLDVVVRVGGAGLCRTDLHVVDGLFAYLATPLPYVLGHEVAGWVHELGSAVVDLEVGDAVIAHPYVTCGFCEPCRRGDDQFCERFKFAGAMIDGGFADFMATDARSLVKLGPSSAPADAVGLADGGLAAYRAVKRSVADLPPGASVVIIGAGGLGHIAVQLLRAMTAAQVIVVDRSTDALDLAASLGAHVVIQAGKDSLEAVREAAAGRGAEVVLDFVGDESTPADAIAMLARRGTYVAVGYGGRLDVGLIDIVANEFVIRGSLIGTHTELAELAGLADRSLVKVKTQVYPLDAIREAMSDLREGRIQGRAVIVP